MNYEVNEKPEWMTSTGRGGGMLIPFLLGAVAGAGLALLYAPVPGHETRARLGRSARQLKEGAGERMSGLKENLGGVKQGIGEAVEGVKDAVASGKQAYARAVGQTTTTQPRV